MQFDPLTLCLFSYYIIPLFFNMRTAHSDSASLHPHDGWRRIVSPEKSSLRMQAFDIWFSGCDCTACSLFKLNSDTYMLWFVTSLKRVFCMFSLLILVIFWVRGIFCLHFADSFYKLVSKLVSFCNKLSVCNYYINHTILIL